MLFENNFVILDLEYTAWEGSIARQWSGKNEHREIIEIGALLVNLIEGKYYIKDIFNELVIPKKNKKLSTYITDLTGITNRKINESGVPFDSAFYNFLSFIDKNSIYQYGNDNEVIKENLRINNIKYNLNNISFKNIRPLIEKSLNLDKDTVDSSDLISHIGLKNDTKHRAVQDCKAILKVINYIIK